MRKLCYNILLPSDDLLPIISLSESSDMVHHPQTEINELDEGIFYELIELFGNM